MKLSPDFHRIVRRPELGWIGGAGNDVESGLRHVVGDEHASLHEFAQHRDPFTPMDDSTNAGSFRREATYRCSTMPSTETWGRASSSGARAITPTWCPRRRNPSACSRRTRSAPPITLAADTSASNSTRMGVYNKA